MSDIKKILENFGFSENEAKVYLAMLKCGEAPVSKVAAQAKLNRITVHHIIERLEEREFAVRFKKGSQRLARAAHPARLQKKIRESSSEFDAIVPELVASMRDDSKKKKLNRYGLCCQKFLQYRLHANDSHTSVLIHEK